MEIRKKICKIVRGLITKSEELNMAVSANELKKAMDTLGISDIHIDKEQAKKIYKKLLLKWHPDACVNGDEHLYNEISAKINAAYETIEKAYEEGLMGPNVKETNKSSHTYKSNSNYTDVYSSSKSSNSDSSNYNKTYTDNSSKTYTSTNEKKEYVFSDYYDSADGWGIVYFRKRWLNIIFLTICLTYIINAILESPKTDIYIEKSVVNLILIVAIYYATYWFCNCLAVGGGFIISGILAWLIYKATTIISMFVYNKIGASFEWLAMLLFIALFFIAEYFIHIKKILLTLDKKIKVKKCTTFFSYFMLLEYAIMLVFGIYSVTLVHKFETIRNVIIPPWY